MTETELTVAKPDVNELEHGAARMDAKTLREIGVDSGDIVEIEGTETTAAKVRRGDPVTQSSTTVQMGGLVRQNAGVSISESVTVRRADPVPADRVVLAPTEEMGDVDGHTAGMVKRQLINDPLVEGDLVSLSAGLNTPFSGTESQSLALVAVETEPGGVLVVAEDTDVALRDALDDEHQQGAVVTYEDIGGLDQEIQRVREMVELPMKHPELFQRLGIEAPQGILLEGPPGTGKTLLAKAAANETDANFKFISGPEIISKYYGESEQQLRDTFDEAEDEAPSIVFIDELDSIAPKREDVSGDVERRIVAQLLTLMDGLEERGQVAVIATTNRVDGVDPALRRPGRFDREIAIGVPDEPGRKEILQIHTQGMPLSEEVDLRELAEDTHGYVGADLEALTKEAAMKALRRYLPDIDLEDGVPPSTIKQMIVEQEDFHSAFVETDPSALREILVEVPEVSWNDVGGLETAKRDLRESVEWPLTMPHHFERLGIDPPSGVLLYGPPGTGKTLLAKAVANETDANFINVRGPELLSKWVGESEQAIRETFQKAREVAPSVVVFDELDSLAADREQMQATGSNALQRVVNQLLSELDGLQKREKVMVVGATNRPDRLDPALVRPGRFDRLVHVNEPDIEGREEILRIHTRGTPLSDDVDLRELAERTEGYVGSDLENVAREAAVHALREELWTETVEERHFDAALEATRATVTSDIRDYFERVEQEFMDDDVDSSSDERTFQ